jgi:hypothetical protein
MRILISLIVLIAFAACSGKKSVAEKETSTKKETPVAKPNPTMDGLQDFLARFERSVINHDKISMLDLMDSDYKKLQFENNFKGNMDRFIDSFFCNYQTNGQGFKCIRFNDITDLKRIEIMPNDGNYTVVYHVSNKTATIKSDYLVLVKKEANKTVYGFYGPQSQ